VRRPWIVAATCLVHGGALLILLLAPTGVINRAVVWGWAAVTIPAGLGLLIALVKDVRENPELDHEGKERWRAWIVMGWAAPFYLRRFPSAWKRDSVSAEDEPDRS